MSYDYEVMYIESAVLGISYEHCLKILTQMDMVGWELVAVDEGMGYFRRLRKDNGKQVEAEEAVEEAQPKEAAFQPQRVRTRGELYAVAYAGRGEPLQ